MAVIRMNLLSKSLGRQTNITVVLPTMTYDDMAAGKEVYQPGMRYQLMYLLHGTYGDETDYLHFTNIVRYADEHKLAVVMPAAANSDYADYLQGPRYFTWITEELPLVLKTLFPISDRREDTFVAGLSMGANGAMKIAMAYPGRFAAALMMSGAARLGEELPAFAKSRREESMALPDLADFYGDLAYFSGSRFDAYAQAEQHASSGISLPRMFFTCGTEDIRALPRCRKAADFLTGLGCDVFYEEVPGYQHEWDFWDLSLRKAIGGWLPLRHGPILQEEGKEG
ncbi:MAG: alpha/beta hydrolase family protein [Oscillospiraceae bacterium]|nr:alpha/beta hydrolase family protein [Oscillospiraceae bacterium]